MIRDNWFLILLFIGGFVLFYFAVPLANNPFQLAGLWAASGIMTAPLLATIISSSLSNFFFSQKGGHPEPIYSIPEKLRHEGKYESSFREYMNIAKEYPQEYKAYQGMIDVAANCLKDESLANQALNTGIQFLKTPSEIEALRNLHKAFISQLHPGEFNQRQESITFSEESRKDS